MGLFGGGNKTTKTTVETKTSTNIRDIGFTGAEGVALATGIADIGRKASADLIKGAIDARQLDANNLRTIVQAQDKGFNRLVGGASELVRTSSEQAGTTFDKIVSSARDIAGKASNNADAILRSATDTVARLGPQTKSNQTIAFVGLGVAAIAVLAFANKGK